MILNGNCSVYALGIPTQRASVVNLAINDINFGVYIGLEDIDSNFALSRFGDNNRAMYKCVEELRYLGENPSLYKDLTYKWSPRTQPVYTPETKKGIHFWCLSLNQLVQKEKILKIQSKNIWMFLCF